MCFFEKNNGAPIHSSRADHVTPSKMFSDLPCARKIAILSAALLVIIAVSMAIWHQVEYRDSRIYNDFIATPPVSVGIILSAVAILPFLASLSYIAYHKCRYKKVGVD